MSEFIFSRSMLVVHTNKNSSIFKAAAERVNNTQEAPGVFGILYDDYDAQQPIYDKWKTAYPDISIMKVAPRRTTVKMDDKIHMSAVLGDAKCAPIAYTSPDDIESDCPDNQLFFVKKRGSTSARGVSIHSYAELMTGSVDTSACIIHKNMPNPKLIDGQRYKLRVYVLVAHGGVYVSRDAWGSSSDVDYKEYDGTMSQAVLKDMHIIYMRPGRKFFKFSDVEDSDKIFNSICKAVAEFSERFSEKVDAVKADEFALLGFDFVVDASNDVCVIEVNHRSNYHHTKEINEGVDVPAIADTMLVLMNGDDNFVHNNTNYVKVVGCEDDGIEVSGEVSSEVSGEEDGWKEVGVVVDETEGDDTDEDNEYNGWTEGELNGPVDLGGDMVGGFGCE